MKGRVASAEVQRESGKVKADGGSGANMAPELRARMSQDTSVRRLTALGSSRRFSMAWKGVNRVGTAQTAPLMAGARYFFRGGDHHEGTH